MLRLFRSSLSLFSVLAILAGCPSKTGGGSGGGGDGDGGDDADVDAATIDQLEASRAAAADFDAALRATDSDLRARAVLGLGRLERLDAVPGILRALVDPEQKVRSNAAFAAGQLDLALDPKRAQHEERRATVEKALTTALSQEQDPTARLAMVRALGRVASRGGLDALVALAGGPVAARQGTTEQSAAFFALGVSGARRKASRENDEALRAAVAAGLVQGLNDDVRAGAAYTAFRQKIPLEMSSVNAALSARDQARIFLARAMSSASVNVADHALPRLLADRDWRVQIEAIRVTAGRADLATSLHADALPAVLTAAVKAHTDRASKAGALHVISESCLALADVGAPVTALPAVSAAVAALAGPAGAEAIFARCSCAAAVEVLGGDAPETADAVEGCTRGLPTGVEGEQRAKHSITALEHARIPSSEKAAALATFLADANTRVRMAAAAAVCADPSQAGADVAATRLVDEPDAGVASALLECFVDGQHTGVLRDRTLVIVSQRFTGGTTFEGVEPLLAVAALARARPGASMAALKDSLAHHSDPRVKEAATDVPGGERAPGPRALVLTRPSVGALPLAAILHTARGEITIAFDRELAPRTVKSFVELANKGTFNNTPFHRVIADFVSQGGDPRGDGSGGPGFTIPCENSDAPFTRGAVGMAHAGKDTGGSQFFLTHSHQPHLDGRYTLFGRVVDGEAVMDALQRDDLLLKVEIATALRNVRK